MTVVITEPISTTNITGLRICTRGSSFLKLSISARPTMSRWNSEIAWRSWVAGICADISSFLLSDGRGRGSARARSRPVRPRSRGPRPVVYLAISASTVASERCRTAAIRCAWIQALASRDVGVEVRGRGVDRVDRDLRHRQAGVVRLVEFEVCLDVFFDRLPWSSCRWGRGWRTCSPPRCTAPPSVAEGRDWK